MNMNYYKKAKTLDLRNNYLVLLHLLDVSISSNTHPLPRLTLSLKVVWHNEIWSNTGPHSRHDLLLETKSGRLRWYEARCTLTKIQLLRGKPWCPWVISRNSCRQRCYCTRCLDLSKMSLQKN